MQGNFKQSVFLPQIIPAKVEKPLKHHRGPANVSSGAAIEIHLTAPSLEALKGRPLRVYSKRRSSTQHPEHKYDIINICYK